jgi:hypothetical protein
LKPVPPLPSEASPTTSDLVGTKKFPNHGRHGELLAEIKK